MISCLRCDRSYRRYFITSENVEQMELERLNKNDSSRMKSSSIFEVLLNSKIESAHSLDTNSGIFLALSSVLRY